MTIEDLRAKSSKEILDLIKEVKAELFILRFKNSTGQLDKNHKIKAMKLDVARMFTILNERKKQESTTNSKKEGNK